MRWADQSALPGDLAGQTFVLTGVNEANNLNSWKEFDARSANLSVTYDRAPYQPTGLSTSSGSMSNGPDWSPAQKRALDQLTEISVLSRL